MQYIILNTCHSMCCADHVSLYVESTLSVAMIPFTLSEVAHDHEARSASDHVRASEMPTRSNCRSGGALRPGAEAAGDPVPVKYLIVSGYGGHPALKTRNFSPKTRNFALVEGNFA